MANKVKTTCIDCGKEKEITKRSLWRIKVGQRSGRCLDCAAKIRNADPEYRKKISLAGKGRIVSEETRRKIGNGHRGKIISEEHKNKISIFFKDRPVSKEHRLALSENHRGYQTQETREKIAKAKVGRKIPLITGENHYRWKGNFTEQAVKNRIRCSIEWREWRNKIFVRDGYQCLDCGENTANLEPHHIIPLSSNMEKAFDINNGITLCRPCHAKTIRRELELARTYFSLVQVQV